MEPRQNARPVQPRKPCGCNKRAKLPEKQPVSQPENDKVEEKKEKPIIKFL